MAGADQFLRLIHDEEGAVVEVDGLVVQNYLMQTFFRVGTDFEPLRRYSMDMIAPFEKPGDALADWYRSARKKIPCVKLVFAKVEAKATEALLTRHLENKVLGDDFAEDSFAIEKVHHLSLLDPGIVVRCVRAAVGREG